MGISSGEKELEPPSQIAIESLLMKEINKKQSLFFFKDNLMHLKAIFV